MASLTGEFKQKMRIGISTRGLNQGSFAISTIVLHLTQKIIELTDSQHEIFLYCNNQDHEALFSRNVYKRTLNTNNRFFWDHVWLPQALKKDHIDIALFMKGSMPALLPCKGTVIFHDLGYFDNQLDPYPPLDTVYMKTMMSRAAKKACHIYADSDYTRNEALRIFGIEPRKISVIYQDCSPIYAPVVDDAKRAEIRFRYHLPANFIFCPVSLSPRKNLLRILNAFSLVKDKISQDLVITGGQVWKSNNIVNRIRQEFPQRIRILGKVNKEDMPGLYSLADFTIYPSLLEGFGMPVLEAFRCDCPILTSNTTSIPEVAGDAAYLINPYDVNEIAAGMIDLATNKKLRQLLISKGQKRAQLFSWEKTARVILDTLENS